jgi:hypothetical protein
MRCNALLEPKELTTEACVIPEADVITAPASRPRPD